MTKDVLIHILESKIQKQRLKDMKEAARKRKITITDAYNRDTVTHLVTEFKELEAVQRKLGVSVADLGETKVVSVEWFTDCMKANRVVPVLPRHKIQPAQEVTSRQLASSRSETALFPEYACQRATPLQHHNEKFTKALELLEKHAELRDGEHDYSRALAFRRASCVLKCLPAPLVNMNQLRNMLNIGGHSRRVIQEILEEGTCAEVETIRNDPWFHKMQLFSGVFGIGPSTAKKWIDKGWNSIAQAQEAHTSSDWRVQWGLGFHEDLTTPVVKQEAEFILGVVQRHVARLVPGCILQLTGGFRRGKAAGHDVDILITHPTEGRETGLLTRLVHSLHSNDIILCGKQERSTYSDDVLTKDFKLTQRGQLDHFEKWLGIVKVPAKVRTQKEPSNDVSVLYERVSQKDDDDVKSGEKLGDAKKIVKDDGLESVEKVGDVKHDVNDDGVENGGGSVTATLENMDGESRLLNGRNENESDKTPLELSREPHDWLARRVDLIISPYNQYFYALVGWTGNKQFNRDLRWYSQRELGMKLTSHGLYDFNVGKRLPATSEQEVFDHLKITYREPAMRNC